MNITKEKADKVIDALSMNRIMARDENGNYTKEITAQVVVEALSIMRGLAEDTELLALFAASQKQLPLNAAISATSPQAARTEGWTGDTEIDAALIMLDRMDVSPDDDARVDEIARLLRKLAGRAGSKP